MGYTAVRGGLDAIEYAERLVAGMPVRSGNPLSLAQVHNHLEIAVGKVMAEGGVADDELASLAIKQSEGDLIEAAFLLRAYRSTLPRVGYGLPAAGSEMTVLRRISSVFRDIPGGQLLGLTRDYTQRLVDFELADARPAEMPLPGVEAVERTLPNVIDFLRDEGFLDPAPPAGRNGEPFDITRMPLRFPMTRAGWLQVLARGESGAMLMLAYSSMRGYGGQGHGSLAELRYGEMAVQVNHPVTGRPVTLGHIRVTESHYISGGHASLADAGAADYRLGYGLTLGRDERKAISMSIVDASLRYADPDDSQPVANQEFVLSHVDAIEASGFVEHLKLPHYVTFQAGIARTRKFKKLVEASRG
jgi:alpha-D-ribose 1-methylphosphonate 5-triphosphate synthase subunit PhnI